jgi:phosphoribosylformimino-5-aminoimidazole carboxamide ribotide isomerase
VAASATRNPSASRSKWAWSGFSSAPPPSRIRRSLNGPCPRYGAKRIAADIGVRDGNVMIRGWQQATPLTLLEAGRRFRAQGLEWCVLTDVRRDGVGSGISVESALELQTATGLKVVASGGVSSLEDVRRVKQAGLAGVIIGRALYEGKISLLECLKLENRTTG